MPKSGKNGRGAGRSSWLAAAFLAGCVPQLPPQPPQVSPLGPVQADWQPGPHVVRRALEACDESVDSQLRLHGMPPNPSPDTPDFDVQLKLYRQCMERRGFVLSQSSN